MGRPGTRPLAGAWAWKRQRDGAGDRPRRQLRPADDGARVLKVNLISYVDPRASGGGGELAMRAHLEEADRRGHVVRHTHRFPRATSEAHDRPDVTILADVWNLPGHWSHRVRRIADAAHVDRAARGYRDRVRKAIDSGGFVHYDN